MDYHSGHVMTLANSIIGVSVLAMPYCFKECGIVLSVLVLLISSIISRLTCHFLIKSALIARRKTFENLAYYIFGGTGKFTIEVGIMGFLIGTCVAFFVVMGDLGPEIISEITGHHISSTMRTSILMALALFCVLPLGLLRNVDSLSGVSRATIGFYFCLVLKIVAEALPHLFRGDWYDHVVFWRPVGVLQCLPIFAMALSCQTQLFEIYQVLHNPTLEKMNSVVRVAVNICTLVYIFVGIFGYIAFAQKPFTGNILISFSPSVVTDIIKIGFVLSVAFSFPLVIFPCRASLYSLLYKEGYPIHEGISNYIPEGKFKGLTLFIVFSSLIIAIMIPNIELVLGLVGSTIGIMICVLFPVTCFIYVFQKNTNERILAKIMLVVGAAVMFLGTYENINNLEKIDSSGIKNVLTEKSAKDNAILENKDKDIKNVPNEVFEKLTTLKNKLENKLNIIDHINTEAVIAKNTEGSEVRHEPPQPIEPKEVPVQENKQEENILKANSDTVANNLLKRGKPLESEQKGNEVNSNGSKEIILNVPLDNKNDEVDSEAIKKEEKEVRLQQSENDNTHQALIETIQKQHEVQKEIVEQQKKLLEVIQKQQGNVEKEEIDKVNEEKLKAVKQIESIAHKAIERIISGKDDKKPIDVLNDTKVEIEHNVKQINEKLEVNGVKVEQHEAKKDYKNNLSLLISKTGNNNLVDTDLSNKRIEESRTKNKYNLLAEQELLKNISNEKSNAGLKKEESVQGKDIDILAYTEKKNLQTNAHPNYNNTAPLFVNLGKKKFENANEIHDLKIFPLPNAANNLQPNTTNVNKPTNHSYLIKNVSDDGPIVDSKKILNENEDNKPVHEIPKDDELRLIRRDILSHFIDKR